VVVPVASSFTILFPAAFHVIYLQDWDFHVMASDGFGVVLTLYWTVPRTRACRPFPSENHSGIQWAMSCNSLSRSGSSRTLDQASRGSRVREPTVQQVTECRLGFVPRVDHG
jgi:hypothetical protein